MNKDNQQELFETYKLHTELTDKLSERRARTNQYYVSILSALFVFIGFYIKELAENSFVRMEFFLLIMSMLGILLCIIWWLNIRSYRQLNSGKFMVLHDLEQKLNYQFFEKEWELLSKGKQPEKYFQLTRVEQISPIIIGIPYLILIIYSIINF